MCRKLNARSLDGAEYFLTFVDDKTQYPWVYVLKVFKRFIEWKTMVERSAGGEVKVLHSDSGGEYTGRHFVEYLSSEGVSHELTVPKTPEQNGVAERLNRTLMEMVRTMYFEGNLPHKFWAEALSMAA